MNNLIGQHLGPYRIIEQIGIGGMATVYKAYQPSMDRYVAIKVLPAVLSRDPSFLKRFRREAKVVAKLEHKHILPVYDYGEQEGITYLVMRYVEAGTLKDRLAAGQLDLPEIYRIIAQVGSALDYAHRLGVIHRDVKPSNVLIDSQGDAYLTDFGLARIVESSEQLTATGVGVGTPAYMAPEQGQGLKIDHRSDIYSLGVMLYEMVTGRVPYQAETPMAVVIKHITEPLPLPRQLVPDLPEEVERVILKALAKKPEDRFQTVREMVEALDFAVRAAAAAAPRAEREFVPSAPAAPARRIRWPWDARTTALGVGLAALALLVIGGMFFALSRIQYRVQVVGGRVEVVPVGTEAVTPTAAVALVETPTGEVALAATTMHTPRPTTTPTVKGTPTRTPRPTEAPSAAPFPPVVVNALAVDPNDPDTIFAGTYGAGIYVSRDGGQTWIPSNKGLGKGTVGSIVVDPNDSNIVYAALFDQGGVYKSTDGGRTWTAANHGMNLDEAWDGTGLVYLDPTDSSRLYYSGTTDGLYHSSDGGTTWQQRGGECPPVTGLAIDPNDGQHLYAAGYQHPGSECLAGVYESTDGGQSWRRLTTEEMVAPGDQFGGDWWHLAADPQDFDIIYAGGQSGIYKTSDGGQSWTPILDQGCDWLAVSDAALYCGRGGGVLISPDGGQSWEEISYGTGWGGQDRRPFAISLRDPQTLYAGTDVVMKSTDGGWTWTRVGWLGAAARMRLAVDPRDGNRLFLSGVDSPGEVYRSEDGGKTWQIIATNPGFGSRLTIDPTQGIIYRPDGSESLYRSRDNGQTWEEFGSGYLTHGPWQLVPDPQDTKKLWLVGECGTRLSLSQDAGETFARVEGFPRDVCFPILLVHRDGRRMYVVDWGGFHRSDDGGETWRSLEGLGGMYYAAALDPSNPDVVYVGSTHKGVLKTENGGFTWRQVNTGLTSPSINELAIDPANPQTIYAATDGGAFVSVDGGENWLPIQEELGPNLVVYSIAVGPNDSSKVYAATPDGIFRLVGAPPEVGERGAVVPTVTPTPSPASASNVYISTDGTWKSTQDFIPGWYQPDYDDSAWDTLFAEREHCPEFPGFRISCLWDFPYHYVPNKALYFRKTFNAARVPPRARIVTLVDDDVDIYLNGTLVLHDSEDTGTRGISWWEVDVTDLIRPGENVLAFKGVDTGEGTAYVQSALGLCFETEDKYPPVVEIMNHWEGWYDGDIYIEAVDAPCDSGVVEVAYRVDGGPWQVVEPHHRFRLPAGEHDVEARATDGAGRQGFDSWHFRIGQP